MRLRPRAQAEESAKCSHLLVIARRLVQLASAAIYAALIPDLSFGTALYHCFVTASTVGYGDVAITTPEARLFACLHIVVSVSWLAALLSSVDTLRKQRESQLQRVETRPEVGSATRLVPPRLSATGNALLVVGVWRLCAPAPSLDPIGPGRLDALVRRLAGASEPGLSSRSLKRAVVNISPTSPLQLPYISPMSSRQLKRAALVERPPQGEQIMALDHDGKG